MNIDIKHKHAGHLIVIQGQAFKANNEGQWDLTDIWQALKLPKGKAPGRWRDADARDLRSAGDLCSQKMDAQKSKQRETTTASKRAAIEYAGWVSRDFKRMVFDAFEAILELPEVAAIVAEKMRTLGYSRSAAMLEREKDNYREAMRAFKRTPQTQSPAAKAHRQLKAQQAKLATQVRANVRREGC